MEITRSPPSTRASYSARRVMFSTSRVREPDSTMLTLRRSPRLTVCCTRPSALRVSGKSNAIRAGLLTLKLLGTSPSGLAKLRRNISTPPVSATWKSRIWLAAGCATVTPPLWACTDDSGISGSISNPTAPSSAFMFSCLIFLLLALPQQHAAGPLHPVAVHVLDNLVQRDLGFRDARDHSVVLAHVVADSHLMDASGRGHESVEAPILPDRANHVQRFQREGLERLARARHVGSVALLRLQFGTDARRRERIDRVGVLVTHDREALQLRQGRDAPHHRGCLLLHPGTQVVALVGAPGQQDAKT